MPKQVNFVPNERVDLNDLTYGTSTFTADSLKSHVQRLMSGDYNGGFVLEGFRVEVTTLGAPDRVITVHNGIALDRDGRLVTFEDGDNFSKNINVPKNYTLTTASGDHYVMVEFAFDDVDDDTRAVWDPTFENQNITDSAGNTHAAPNGKEFPLNVPTRRAISWRIVVVPPPGGFSDRADLGTEGHTLRIPIAIIPVTDGGSIDIGTLDREKPWTSVIETPQEDDDFLVCANTRLFEDTGRIEVRNSLGGILIPASVDSGYGKNDDDNNVIASLTQNGTSTLLEGVRAGDVVIMTEDYNGNSISDTFVVAGSKWDARPMLLSFTDPIAASQETANKEREPRNQRYDAAIALLRKYVTSVTSVDYPSSSASSFKVQLNDAPDRVENNLKQGQDLFRALGALIREMKYGAPINLYNTSDGPNVIDLSGEIGLTNTKQVFTILIGANHPEFYSGLNTFAVGATLTFTATTITGPIQNESKEITSISSNVHSVVGVPNFFYYVVTVDSEFSEVPVAGDTLSITKGIESNTKFVDNYNIGNLNEVYRARIDRITNSWSSDLQDRLAANKIPVVTVGDGFNTFGDFNGNSGLEQALIEVNTLNTGGIIYVKRGAYSLGTYGDVKSNTIVMGDGAGASVITFANAGNYFRIWPFTGETSAYNIQFKDISIIAATSATANTAGRWHCISNRFASIPVTNLTIDNCYMKGGSFYDNVAAGANFEKRYTSLLDLEVGGTTSVANSGIKILNSRFFIEGSGLYFQGSRNVQIDNCIFESETNRTGTDFVGLVEGIVFDGGSPVNANSVYGGEAISGLLTATVEGEVTVSNCRFRGPQRWTGAPAPTLPPRGWVFFSPTFTGQNSSVTDCQFIGDTEGEGSFSPVHPPFSRLADSKVGVGIVSASAEIVFISDCMFHSYTEGIRALYGKTIINDCSFIELYNGVRIGKPNSGVTAYNFDYALVDTDWIFYPWVDFNTQIKGCSFSGMYTPALTATGVDLLPQQSYTTASSVSIKDCNFNNITHGVSYDEISTYTQILANIPAPYYDLVEISSSTFTNILGSCVAGGYAIDSISGTAPSARSWAITTFCYSNNVHKTISTSNTGSVAINVSGETINVEGNFVEDMVVDTARDWVFRAWCPRDFVFSSNTIKNCQCTVNSNIIHMIYLEISLGNETSYLTINNNTIRSQYAASDLGINNGIFISGKDTTVDNGMYADLHMENNEIFLRNGNYMLLSSQDELAVPRSRIFMWSKVTITNNYLNNYVANDRIPNFSSHSNDATYDTPGVTPNKPLNIQYLGGQAVYCGMIDLRLFREYTTGSDPTVCSITNNVVTLTNNPAWQLSGADKGDTIAVGLRITHWPKDINIEGNTFHHAPIILNNNWWNARNDSAHSTLASTININNNTVSSSTDLFPCLIDITPATGVQPWAGVFAALLPIYRTKILMNNNSVTSGPGQTGVGTYTDFYNVVRFGQLQKEFKDTAAPTGDSQINDTVLYFSWLISDNQFDGMPLIFGYGKPLPTSPTQAGDESNGTYVGKLTISTAGHDWAGGGNNALPNASLITVEENQFSFIDGCHNDGHVLGTTERLGIARLYCGDTQGTADPGGSTAKVLATTIAFYPDTGGLTPALGRIQSCLIIQNNSATYGRVVGGPPVEHAFTGSYIDQG